MAGYEQASAAKYRTFDILDRAIGVRPVSVGIVPLPADQYGLRVMLPRDPGEPPPAMVLNVPVQYTYGDRPVKAGQTMSAWRKKALDRSR